MRRKIDRWIGKDENTNVYTCIYNEGIMLLVFKIDAERVIITWNWHWRMRGYLETLIAKTYCSDGMREFISIKMISIHQRKQNRPLREPL